MIFGPIYGEEATLCRRTVIKLVSLPQRLRVLQIQQMVFGNWVFQRLLVIHL